LTKATIEMLEGESIGDGFELLIGLAEIHVPRMWVERKPDDQNHQVIDSKYKINEIQGCIVVLKYWGYLFVSVFV
jgi:hypothetical protein